MYVYERQKAACGKWAAIVWIGSGIYWIAVDPAAKFLSWQAAVYFIVGMFLAAIVFGIFGYILQRVIAKVLMQVIRTHSRGLANLILALGFVIMIAIMAVVFVTSRWCVQFLFT